MNNRFKRLLSILLSICLVFSLTTVYSSAEETEDTKTIVTLYVQSPGYDKYDTTAADGSAEKPFETVYDLITYVNANEELGAGDTVNAVILQQSETTAFDSTTMIHNLTSWTDGAADGEATVPAHEYTLVLKSPENENNYLAFSKKLADNVDMLLAGPTVFDNVTILSVRNSDGKAVCFEGNDVTFTENCYFKHLKHAYDGGSWDQKFYTVDMPLLMYKTTSAKVCEDATEININSATGKLYIPSSYAHQNNATYKQDVSINVNNTETTLSLLWGICNPNTTATFEKNLNINVKAATSITNAIANTSREGKIQINGGLQIISAIDFDISALTNVTATSGIWNLKNTSANKNLITFTETAGTYNVADGYTVTATGDNGTYTSSDGTLVITTPGSYTLTASATREYYVQSPGYDKYGTTTADGSAEKPFETVYDLITYVNTNEELGAGDTVNAVILQDETTDAMEKFDSTTGIHNMTSWTKTETKGTAGIATIPKHDYTLVLKSPETKNYYLAFSYKLAENVDMLLSGPTVFDNVTVVNVRNSDGKAICFEGNDVTFTENCKFKYLQWAFYTAGNTPPYSWSGNFQTQSGGMPLLMYETTSAKVCEDATEININSATGKLYIPSSYTYQNNATYKQDVSINVDNAAANLSFLWGICNPYTTTTFEKNLNINVKAATSITNAIANTSREGKIQINGGLQIISAIDFDISALTNVTATKGIWNLKNTSAKDMISFVTDENGDNVVGKYNVTEGYIAIATNETTGEVENSVDGVLDLTDAPSTYTITFKEDKSEKYKDYINYRNGIGNTYSALTTGDKDLNVVYFGGSVTVGAGSSDRELYSWRARVGNWLTANFPNATVNNINQAIGDTGTYLGCYRVACDIVSKAPDLLFIEYSINDYYNNTSEYRASMQFETIVRTVKEEYPNCDIVTILVTDYSNVENASNGILHTQAKAHEEISEKYNIPSIHVGRALGTELVNNGWKHLDNYNNDTVWLKYITDVVHPTDAGYELYFNVIKEFLNNELNYGEYDGTVKTNEMPEMVNKYLFDGDVTYIDESTAEIFNVDEDESLYATYDPDGTGIVSKENYQGIVKVPAGSQDYVKVTFTGTELVMVTTSGHDKDNTFEYSLDDGATWTTGKYNGKNPTAIVTGLQPDTYTVLIKTASGAATNTLISGFFSRNATKVTNKLKITDLVQLDSDITAAITTDINYRDYNNDGVISNADIRTLKKILINNK